MSFGFMTARSAPRSERQRPAVQRSKIARRKTSARNGEFAEGGIAAAHASMRATYIDKQTGERVDRTEWHRVVTFQEGLVDMFQKHATKGRLVYVAGKMQTRRWRKDGEDNDRFSTEILLVPGGRIQFLDKPNGANGDAAPASNGEATPPAAQAPADMGDDIPY